MYSLGENKVQRCPFDGTVQVKSRCTHNGKNSDIVYIHNKVWKIANTYFVLSIYSSILVMMETFICMMLFVNIFL